MYSWQLLPLYRDLTVSIIRPSLQSSWTDSRPSSTQQLVCQVWSVMPWSQITLHLCWMTYTGYESGKDPVQAMCHCVKCQHSLAPTYLSDQLQQVARMEPRQRLRSSSSSALVVRSYHLLELRHWLAKRFLSLPPGRETVCRQQSLLRQPFIHPVEPKKIIYSPHLSHHHSYIICILS